MRNRKLASILVTYARTCMERKDYRALIQALSDQILADAANRGTNGKDEAEDFINACDDFNRAPIEASFNDGTKETF